MTFDEYAEKYLQALSSEARRLVQMGWNGREEFGAGHNADAGKMVQGDVSLMGDITIEDGTTFGKALVVQFPTVDDFHAAREAGHCRFTVFGGPV